MKTHKWQDLLNSYWNQKVGNLQWCSGCGAVKAGPFSEHGAYNYFLFYIPGRTEAVEQKIEPMCQEKQS